MKKILNFSVALFIAIVLFGCSSKPKLSDLVIKDGVYYVKDKTEPFTGKINEKYSNGKDSLIANIEKGKFNGVYISYYENGNMRDSILYDKGNVQNIKSWLENGSIKKTSKTELFKDKDGFTCIVDIKNDTLFFTGIAIDSNVKVSGEKLIEEETFSSGELNGPTTRYYSNGKKRLEGAYVKGVEDGKWTWYKKNGQVENERVYKDGSYAMKCACCGKEYQSKNGVSGDVEYQLYKGFRRIARQDDGGEYCSAECVLKCWSSYPYNTYN